MVYTPRALEVFDRKEILDKLVDRGVLAIRSTTNGLEACITLGAAVYKKDFKKGEVMDPKEFRFISLATITRESINGVYPRQMLELEMQSLGNYGFLFDYIEYDSTSKSTTLVKKAAKNYRLIRDSDGNIKFKESVFGEF